MLSFQPIELEHKSIIQQYAAQANYRNCDFSFANLYCWKSKFKTSFVEIDGFLLLSFICEDGLPCFMMPIGNGNLTAILHKMINDANEKSYRFRIHAVTEDMYAQLHEALPDKLLFREYRDFFEYIYLTEDLIRLSGKKYQSKRNHANRFERENSHFQIEQISADNKHDCLQIYEQWVEEYHKHNAEENLNFERQAVITALEHFQILDLSGILIRVGEQAVAFSYGAPLNNDTFCVHAEKAISGLNGTYAFVNRTFATMIAKDYRYLNREEDLGIESLRKAKLSYHPFELLHRGSVCLKNDPKLSVDETICS